MESNAAEWGAVVLDTNALIAAVEYGQSVAVLGGRIPIVSITTIKQFLRGAGRAGHRAPKPIAEVPLAQRKPNPHAYGQELLTATGVFGLRAGHTNRALGSAPQTGALFVGVGAAGHNGGEPEGQASVRPAHSDGPRLPARDR